MILYKVDELVSGETDGHYTPCRRGRVPLGGVMRPRPGRTGRQEAKIRFSGQSGVIQARAPTRCRVEGQSKQPFSGQATGERGSLIYGLLSE